MVIIFWCILACLGTDEEFNGTWLKFESPRQRDKTSTQWACRLLFWWFPTNTIMLDNFTPLYQHIKPHII
jgi:hypothetical protein